MLSACGLPLYVAYSLHSSVYTSQHTSVLVVVGERASVVNNGHLCVTATPQALIAACHWPPDLWWRVPRA